MAGGTLGGGGDDDGGVISDINVTPLVDVTLVLLIIMMVTAPMLSEQTAIKVDLPKGKTGEAAAGPGQQRTLLVGKGGQVQIDGVLVNVDELREKLTGEAKLKPDMEVGVAADKAAEYGQVISVLDAIRSAGVTKFSLQMEGDGAPAAAAALGAAIGATPAGTPGTAPAPGAAPDAAAPAGDPTAPGAPAAPANAAEAPAEAPAAAPAPAGNTP